MKGYHRTLEMTLILTEVHCKVYPHIKLLTMNTNGETTQPFQVRVPISIVQLLELS